MKLCLNCFHYIDDQSDVCPHCGYRQSSPPKEPHYMKPGTIIHDRYIVGTAIGSGGFSVTYRGYDAQLNQIVAIKEYLPAEFCTRASGEKEITVYSDEEKKSEFKKGKEKFKDEARRMAQLRGQKNIVQIFNTFDDDNTAYIIMELIDGVTLESYINKNGRLSVEESLEIMIPLLGALNAIHAKGMLHRDVTPSNIMLTKDHQVKLLDFGSARYASANHSKSLTVLFKEGFTPEEQYQSQGNQGPWSDVYSAAATMYYMITGIRPESALNRRLNDEIVYPSKLGIEISHNVETALMNALSVDASQRTPTARRFMTELTSDGTVSEVFRRTKETKNPIVPRWLKIGAPAVLAVIILACVLVAHGLGISIPGGTSSVRKNQVLMPRVVGLDISNAKKKLNQASISYQIKTTSDESVGANEVISQSTAAGQVFNPKEKTVTLVYSTGGKALKMPYVLGRNVQSVVKELRRSGVHRMSLTYAKSDTFAKNTIMKSSVQGDHTYNTADLLSLKVSKGSGSTSGNTNMPSLTGKNINDIGSLLKKNGLHIQVKQYNYIYTKKIGTILNQSIAADREIAKGSVVYVNVSAGKRQVTIPDVTGLTADEAKNRLESLNLQYDAQTAYSDKVEEGKVISQDAVNKTVEEKTVVTCTISEGSKPFAMPDVVGKTKIEAEGTLEEKGLIPHIVYKNSSDNRIPLGSVWYQEYKAGSDIQKGKHVTLFVRMVTIRKSNFVGGQSDEATALLTNEGIQYKIKRKYNDQYEPGIVTDISPTGNIKNDQEITLTVSKGIDPRSFIKKITGKDN